MNCNITGICLKNYIDDVNFIAPDGITIIDSYSNSSSSNVIRWDREVERGPIWITITE